MIKVQLQQSLVPKAEKKGVKRKEPGEDEIQFEKYSAENDVSTSSSRVIAKGSNQVRRVCLHRTSSFLSYSLLDSVRSRG